MGQGVQDKPFFMNNLKLFGKNEEQLDSLVNTVNICIDIGVEFGLRQCGILTLKRGKVVRSDRKEFLNCEVMGNEEI